MVLNAVLGTVALVGAGLAYHLVTATAQTTPTTTSGGRTIAVTQGEVTATVSASGSVQSASTATADFATSGTVTAISVHVGDTVAQGQELARIDPAPTQATVDTAYANLNAAKASLTRAQNEGDDATIAAAQAQVTNANANLDAANRALAGTVLTAPMAGTVTAVTGSVGATTGSSSGGTGGSSSGGNGASSGSSGFIALADLTKMQVSASFAEADATRLKTGQTATVTWAALTGATATGTVATIAPTATTSNNVNSYATVVTLGTLPTGVRIGQTVTVSVVVGHVADAVRVPTAAVRTAGNRRVVTVVTNGVEEVRPVEVGVEGDTFVEVTSGLQPGEQVAIVVSSTTTTNNGGPGFGGGGFGGGGFGGGGLGGGGRGGGAGGAGGGGGGTGR
jgi:macrolide-specific efflux system membrane fusion protein